MLYMTLTCPPDLHGRASEVAPAIGQIKFVSEYSYIGEQSYADCGVLLLLTSPASLYKDLTTTVSLPTPWICLHLTMSNSHTLTCCHQKPTIKFFQLVSLLMLCVALSCFSSRLIGFSSYSHLCSALKYLPWSHFGPLFSILASLRLFMSSLQP